MAKFAACDKPDKLNTSDPIPFLASRAMTSIPMPEFNRDWQAALLKVRQGETVVILENGKPLAHLSPAAECANKPQSAESQTTASKGLLWMTELADKWVSDSPESKESLTNEQMDRIIYDH